MPTIIRDYQEGELISDERDIYEHYTYEELDGAVFLSSNDITGAETFQLTNGKIAVLQSIDLDFIQPNDDHCLRTVSLNKDN